MDQFFDTKIFSKTHLFDRNGADCLIRNSIT